MSRLRNMADFLKEKWSGITQETRWKVVTATLITIIAISAWWGR